MATQGDPTLAAEALALLDSDIEDLSEVLIELT